MPKNPLDGIDIWPLMTGQKKEIEREALLYFEGWYLQCARLGRWKLDLTRANGDSYSATPAGGRKNFPLVTTELYDVVTDTNESYNVADKHPEIVKDIRARVTRLIIGFPEEVRKAWAETQSRVNVETRSGAYAREASKL
jgi:hypothetical protein